MVREPGRRWSAARLAILPAVVLGACATSADRATPQDLAGCYYFDRNAAAEELQLPWGVRLSDAALDDAAAPAGREDARRATTLTGRAERDHPFGYWVVLPGDTMEMGYPGSGGLVLRLTMDERDLTGTARPVGDALRPGQEPGPRPARPVRLMWARCPED